MSIIETLSGPVIGAAIGYCTNYIAVKMLFRPVNPIRLGKYTLPFTPGVIPKRKKEFAMALGTTISNTLITQEELEKALLSDGMKQSITNGIADYVINMSNTTMTIKESLSSFVSEKDYEEIKSQLQQLLSQKMLAGLSGIDFGQIIASEAGAAVKEKLKGNMLAMMLSDSMIASLTEPIGERVKEYIKNHGMEKIQPAVIGEIECIENQSMGSVLSKILLYEKQIKELVERIYTDCITSASGAIARQIDIVGIVKNKIQDMDVKDMEKLVLSVMKNELDTVINLGAVLGFLIGLLNLIF
ncbi:MAG TPA: DUF445 family protein [Pseudobacteroides sp.]|uniref:DUF445 domain-containing protein n=1 Tax=Pseudobacteroides sp. TaxID=1968840 RepID=UPI002F94AE77